MACRRHLVILAVFLCSCSLLLQPDLPDADQDSDADTDRDDADVDTRPDADRDDADSGPDAADADTGDADADDADADSTDADTDFDDADADEDPCVPDCPPGRAHDGCGGVCPESVCPSGGGWLENIHCGDSEGSTILFETAEEVTRAQCLSYCRTYIQEQRLVGEYCCFHKDWGTARCRIYDDPHDSPYSGVSSLTMSCTAG